jgi:carbon-monoxide dehydrogenase medium subunit
MRLARPGVLVDVNGIGELDYVREADGALAVGALVRQRKLEPCDLSIKR